MTDVSLSKSDPRQILTDYTSLSVDTVTIHVVGAASLDLAEQLEADGAVRGGRVGRREGDRLLGLRCRLTGHDVFLTGSLSRLVHGTNVRAVSPEDVAYALSLIADALGLSLPVVYGSRVYRLDIAANLVVPRPPADHLPALVDVPRAARQRYSPTSLAFVNRTREVAVYDKLAEIVEKGGVVPSELAGRHVLRYELRLKRDVKGAFGRPITAADLTRPSFHSEMARVWANRYETVRTEPVVELGSPGTVPAFVGALARLGAASVGQPRVLDAVDGLLACGVVSADMRGKMRRRLGELMADPDYATESDVAAELALAVRTVASAYRTDPEPWTDLAAEFAAAIDAAVGAAPL